MRLVADQIRGKKVNNALSILKFSPKHASNRLEKLFNDIKIQARRIPTKPSRSSKVKRVETKKKRSKLKKSRMKVGLND